MERHPIYQAVTCYEENVEFVRASIELQGKFEGWSIPQIFQYSERDEGVLESLYQFLQLDASLGWTGYFLHNALINCIREAI